MQIIKHSTKLHAYLDDTVTDSQDYATVPNKTIMQRVERM